MNISITAKDGNVFKGENFYELERRVISYEAELDKKEKEEEKKLTEKEKAYQEIKDAVKSLTVMMKEYELDTKDKLYICDYLGELEVERMNITFKDNTAKVSWLPTGFKFI
jgi:hypothetical protein